MQNNTVHDAVRTSQPPHGRHESQPTIIKRPPVGGGGGTGGTSGGGSNGGSSTVAITQLQVVFHTKGDDKDDSATLNIEFLMDNRRVAALSGVGYNQQWSDYSNHTVCLAVTGSLLLADVVKESYGDASVNDRRGLWMHVTESRDNTGWRTTYEVYAYQSDGSNHLIGVSGGEYNLFDNQQPCILDRMDTGIAGKPNNRDKDGNWVTI